MEQKIVEPRIKHKTNTADFPLVEVSRTLNAPIDRVWEAWKDPELIKQWWGPVGFSAPAAKSDFRVGGKYLFAMKDNEEHTTWSAGTYEEIVPQRLIVYTDQFSDENGKILDPSEVDMPAEWVGSNPKTFVTVEFQDKDGKTEMHLTHEGLPQAVHDDCVDGWTSTVDKLQNLVESH